MKTNECITAECKCGGKIKITVQPCRKCKRKTPLSYLVFQITEHEEMFVFPDGSAIDLVKEERDEVPKVRP